jgi:hypothetical protein
MGKRKKKTAAKKSATTFRLKNASLGADFEIFLPEGWNVSRSAAKSSKQASAKKGRKRR